MAAVRLLDEGSEDLVVRVLRCVQADQLPGGLEKGESGAESLALDRGRIVGQEF